MSDIDSLIHRYLEDRASLAARELDELIAALRADPELASSLREQLLLDDLLAQKLTLDRRNFVAQVEQRIADVKRGHEELSQQTADVRSLAAAERANGARAAANWRWSKYILAISTLMIVGLTIYAARLFAPHPPAIAKVTALEGDVKKIEQDGESTVAELDGALESGEQIVVPQGGAPREGRFSRHVWRRRAGCSKANPHCARRSCCDGEAPASRANAIYNAPRRRRRSRIDIAAGRER